MTFIQICGAVLFLAAVLCTAYLTHQDDKAKRRPRAQHRSVEQSSHVRVVQGENVVAMRRKAS